MPETPSCLLRTLEAAERLPMTDEPESWELIREIEKSVVDIPAQDQVILECGRCLRTFDTRMVGGGALFLSGGRPCPRFNAEL